MKNTKLVLLPVLILMAALVLTACGAGAQGDEAKLQGVVWQWVRFDDTGEVNNIEVPNPESYTLEFKDDGTYQMRADCNTGGGGYTQDGSSLTIEPGMMTLMACEPGSLDAEFLTRLGNVATYVIQDGMLYLNLKMDSGNMVFQPAK